MVLDPADPYGILGGASPGVAGVVDDATLDALRTNPGEYSEAQKKSTYQELLRYNRDYGSRGRNPFRLDVLQNVAENYYIIQKQAVKRCMKKKVILAAFVFHTCIDRGFTRTRAEVAELLQLAAHGIARGGDYRRSIDEDRGLEIDINTDRLRPHFTSAFAHLDRTATFEVLRRKGVSITIGDVSQECGVRKHTIRRFLDELGSYHSYFEGEYRRFGLNASLPVGDEETV